MKKQLVTFLFATLMTSVAFGQLPGPTAYTIGILFPMDDSQAYIEITNLSEWCQTNHIGITSDGQFTGLEWKNGIETGNLIGCWVRDLPNDPNEPDGEFYEIIPGGLATLINTNAPVDMTDLSFNKFDGRMYSIDAVGGLWRDNNTDSIPEAQVGTFPVALIVGNVGLAFDEGNGGTGDLGDLYILNYVTDSIYRVPSADVINDDLANITTIVGPGGFSPMGFNSDGSQGLDFYQGVGYHAAFNADFGLIFDSPPDQLETSAALINQEFPDFPDFSSYLVCDVSFAKDVTADVFTIWSTDTLDGAFQNNVTMARLNVFPKDEKSDLPTDADDPTTGMLVPVTIEEVLFDNDTPSNPNDDFAVLKTTACGVNLPIPPGNYWIGLTFDADFATNGQSFTVRAVATSGDAAAIRNPGGGFGFTFGTSWGGAGQEILADPTWEMAMQIREQEFCGGRAELYTFDATGNYQFVGAFPNDTVRVGDLTLTVPAGCSFVCPMSYTVFRGMEIAGSVADFCESDDVRARYNPGFVLNAAEAPVWLVFDANAPTAIDFLVESQAGTPGLTYTVEAWNWNIASYDIIGTQGESFNADTVVTFPITPADHIDTGGDVRSRVGWRKTGLTLNFPWEVRVDQVGWNQ